MSLTEATVTAIDSVSRNLRVPEFKYAAKDESEFCELIDEYFSRYELQRQSEEPGLNALRVQYFAEKQFPTRFINLIFLVDRCFDVWLRKSALDADIQRSLSPWRIVLLRVLYCSVGKGSSSLMIVGDLLDAFSVRFKSWCNNPERARKQVPDLLDAMRIDLSSSLEEKNFAEVQGRWQAYVGDADKKAEKIRHRLASNEQSFVSQRYCGAKAQQYLNAEFKSRKVSVSLQVFLESVWLNLVALAIEKSEEAIVPDEIHRLTRKMRAVFCDKGKAAFQFGEGLADALQEQLSHYQQVCPEEALQSLVDETIAILKGQAVPEQDYKTVDGFESFSVFSQTESASLREGEVFLDPESRIRLVVLKVYSRYAQVLLVNYLGMKLEIDTVGNFCQRIQSGKLKKVAADAVFSKVAATTVNGLQKVSSTQLQAREKAAEKARLEAQRLREEQAQAAEHARMKAAEIARRTRELASKKEEAKRLESERKALELISKLSLGAWISIDRDNEKQRYKLAVKFAAKKRYVFVDKYGVKKIEFDENRLVDEIVEQRLQVLNDGADFDDSLERVIGRMRMSR